MTSKPEKQPAEQLTTPGVPPERVAVERWESEGGSALPPPMPSAPAAPGEPETQLKAPATKGAAEGSKPPGGAP